MCEALFYIILVDIAKVRKIFSISISNHAAKIYSKNDQLI